MDLRPSSHDSWYDDSISSTVASFGMLMVFEIAPVMNGCAAAIIRM